jgi:GNAT superfamily N-acetyltransferase
LAAGQSEESDASLAKLAARGYRLVEDVQDSKYNHSLFSVVDDAGDEVASAHMQSAQRFPGSLNALDLEVNPPYRGKGIAGEMYDAIEEATGRPVKPSGHLTPEGAKFWRRRDKETLDQLLKEGYFDLWDSSGIVREALEGSLFGPPDPSKTVGF